jgi:acyl-CoA synthetase (NDP forming)
MQNSHRIDALLRPKSIAIVGASPDVKKVSGRILATMKAGNFAGKIYPVNPRRDEILGLPCYATLDDIPGSIDHCVIALPAEDVPRILDDCNRIGVKTATIIAAGYAELGEAGRVLQEKLVQSAGGMTFLGPNSMGFANLVDGLFATSVPTLERQIGAGDVALVSQSGGLSYSASWFMAEAKIDLSYLVMTGNAAGVSFGDLLEFFFDDANTKVVVMLIESDAIVAHLIAVIKRHGLQKPVVLLKVGRGETGIAMAKSHTGSLAGDFRVARDCAEQAGIVVVDDLDEAVGCTSLLRHDMGAKNGNDIVAMSVSGGNVVLFADHADQAGMRFAQFSETTRRRLREVLPDFIAVQNPVDLTTQGYVDPTLQEQTIRILAEDSGVSTILPIITASANYQPMCQSLANLAATVSTPLIVIWTGGSYDTESRGILAKAGIPVFYTPNLFMRCFGAIKRADHPKDSEATASNISNISNASAASNDANASNASKASDPAPAWPDGSAEAVTLSEGQSMRFLHDHQIPVARFAQATRADVVALGESLGYPLVLKKDVSETHISDNGGVVLDLRSREELVKAADTLVANAPDTLLIVSQFRPGLELIASAFVHPVFGPLLMTGSGGIWTEALADVRFIPLPASRGGIERALRKTAIGKIIDSGTRGASGFAPTVDLLQNLARCLLSNSSEVTQIEINPLTVSKGVAIAVDASVTRIRP